MANCSTNDDGDDILCAKLHLVDLAGSERAKRTGADEMRLREGNDNYIFGNLTELFIYFVTLPFVLRHF